MQGNKLYLDILPKIVSKYDNTKHWTSKMTPNEASESKKIGTVYVSMFENMKKSLKQTFNSEDIKIKEKEILHIKLERRDFHRW